ncbi:CDP-glycerol glycerophosphotransferase family protein [Thermococcus sibiricus]|uniref:CDP-glycerol:poly(Glycerophosphate) glycerophosphotransferase n=1 Tax=Thermococcus sibiricus (strain DSM 12597 / MM 739) TaxID=604354 RepID=C6A086_THESM|nr:CDP-glycerol glycerophosphotransferase family protein [Thermococcus sibiricus]ACS91067.1 CDP-glycerol:poly(glycerophosphate) glycerophosphotransferase [Thermococcus sibiricus MM 739]
MKLKPLIHYVLSRIFAKINRLIPKDGRVIMFISTPDFSDNPRYLYEKAKELLEGYKFVWVVNDKTKFQNLDNESTVFVQYRTFEYLKWIIKAKYLILSHGVPYWKSGNQIAILLWHGLPIKRDGVWIKNYWHILPDFLTVPSRFVGVIYSSLFGVPPQDILELGIPRTDVLFLNKNNEKLKVELKEKLNLPLDKKVVLYAPTWREWNPTFQFKLFLELATNKELQKVLKINNAMLVFKPHPQEEANILSYEFPKNFHIITSNNMLKKGLTTNELLLVSDLLITDYSSIFWDYLILDRPMIFYVPDIDDYRAHRGLILEPFEEWVPGKIAYSVDALVKTISGVLEEGKDGFEYKRKWLRNIMYKHQDGKSSERIIRYFFHISRGEI